MCMARDGVNERERERKTGEAVNVELCPTGQCAFFEVPRLCVGERHFLD